MKKDELQAERYARSEASMREYLCSLSWPEKVRSIERMNAAMKIAQKAMREALAREASERSQS